MRRRRFLTGTIGISTAAIVGAPAATARPAPQITAPGRGPSLEDALYQPPPAAPIPLAELAFAVQTARHAFRAAQYKELGAQLPMLLATADASREASSGHAREQAHALASYAYGVASELAIKQRSKASSVAAERALAAARACGQPTPIGEAARMSSVVMRHAGQYHDAVALLTHTCAALDDTADMSAQAVRASLLLTCSYTAAHTGDRALALDLVTQAHDIGRRTAGRRQQFTLVATNEQCEAFKISIFNALGCPDEAVPHARAINPAVFPSRERRARFFTDTARMWHQLGDQARTYAALREIERQAPEEACRPSVRALTADLLSAPASLPGLMTFARRTGAASC